MRLLAAATLLTVLAGASLAAPPPPSPETAPRGLIGGVVGAVGGVVNGVLDLGAAPPPAFLRTNTTSPQCANVNQGEYLCCQVTVAGDHQLVVLLADKLNYQLNPNDINGVNCE